MQDILVALAVSVAGSVTASYIFQWLNRDK